MGLQGLKRVLQKCPPLFHAARAVQSTGRTLLGPAWLQRQVHRRAASGKALKIVIGSSQIFDEGWIPTNVQYLNLLVDEHWQRAFGKHPIDAMLAEHVWEHLTLEDGRAAAAQCFKYLKPSGYLRIAVPDGFHPDPEYIEFVRPGGSGPGARDHHVLWNYRTLREVLESVGFSVDLIEYYDEQGNFHAEPFDQSAGHIWRCKGFQESKPDGSFMDYSSLLVDARKPT